jgi:aryl-alcohol dehydrogenase-like predicted oxidoreductase
MPLERVPLGSTGLTVTRLGFGTLPLGPMQANLPAAQGAALIRYALEHGVNFLDTAASYRTYAHIRQALDGFGGEVIIATKTGARTYQVAEEHIQAALTELGADRLDVCHIHGARAAAPFIERAEVLQCLLDYQAKGYIRYLGISTHIIDVVRQAADRPEIQVIHPLINQAGMGVIGGTAADMAEAIAYAHAKGKGIYAMKALAGGNLLAQREAALGYVLNLPGVDAAVVGMVTTQEIDFNLAVFSGETVTPEMAARTPLSSKRILILRQLCQGCGDCVAACPSGALSLVEDKSAVETDKCILCGYCSPVCKQLAIRMV